jgi:hypothetical protein
VPHVDDGDAEPGELVPERLDVAAAQPVHALPAAPAQVAGDERGDGLARPPDEVGVVTH